MSGKPNRRANRLDIAAAYFPGRTAIHAAGCLMSDVRIDEVTGGAAERANFRDPRQRQDDHRLSMSENCAALNPPGSRVGRRSHDVN